jgi:aspartate-semialdehyde dehydrogenase
VARAKELLASSPGVAMMDIPAPLEAAGKDPTYVGRNCRDPTADNGLMLFISTDNLRKGAALNAVQIAELVAVALSTVPPHELSQIRGKNQVFPTFTPFSR